MSGVYWYLQILQYNVILTQKVRNIFWNKLLKSQTLTYSVSQKIQAQQDEQKRTNQENKKIKNRIRPGLIPLCDHSTVILWGCISPCPHLALNKWLYSAALFTLSSLFYLLLFFQNHHEWQPAGDPGSSVCSKPTPTLHVSKYSISDSHVSHAFKKYLHCCVRPGSL